MQDDVRSVVVNADDFGIAPGVNRGIIEAHRAGTLSSASMMVNTPAFEAASELARTNPSLGVGLHFNLLSGKPLSEIPTLADPRTGNFYSLGELARRAFIGRISPVDVRRECDAQIAALHKAGIVPSHLDSHRHTHALPGILAPVLASARAAGIRFVRRPLDRLLPAEPRISAKMLALHGSWRAALRALDNGAKSFAEHAPQFRGIALQGAVDVEKRLLSVIERLPAGATEIMLHPGYDDATLGQQDPYRMEREREVRALTSTLIHERLTRGDIRLMTFRELAA